jgi:hypothetical protein
MIYCIIKISYFEHATWIFVTNERVIFKTQNLKSKIWKKILENQK